MPPRGWNKATERFHLDAPIHAEFREHRCFQARGLVMRLHLRERDLAELAARTARAEKSCHPLAREKTHSRAAAAPLSVCGRRRRRSAGRTGGRRDHDRLADLQFPIVLNMIELLQFLDGYVVHFRDRGEGLAFRDDVAIAGLLRRLGRFSRRARAARCRRWGRRRLTDHHSRPHLGNLLLQFQNLLGERIDLRVLVVDLLAQGLERFLRLVVAGKSLRGRRCTKEDDEQPGNRSALHGLAFWHLHQGEASVRTGR